MKCQECEPLIEEYLDGELDRRAAEGVRAHLASCAACAEARDEIVAEGALYASYEREVEVTPQLWGRVEARLRAERRVEGELGLLQRVSNWLAPLLTAPRFSPALTGALVVLAVLATVGAMTFLGPRAGGNNGDVAKQNEGARPEANTAPVVNASTITSQPGAGASPEQRVAPDDEQQQPSAAPSATGGPKLAAGPSPKKGIRERLSPKPDVSGGTQLAAADGYQPNVQLEGARSADRLVREAEKRYQAAIKILERDVRGRRSQLDAETLARFDETLTSIDRTIAETRKAVRQQGSDPVAVQYMLSAYAKKVEVMREMAHLGQGN